MKINFQDYLIEAKAAEQAHKLGLAAAGFGLWKDKTGKVVKKTVGDKLIDVRGSAAKMDHYPKGMPQDKEPNHAEHDQSSDIVAEHETEGTKRKSNSTKHHIIEHSSVSKENAVKIHEALVHAGYKHSSSAFGQTYVNGLTSILISSRPEVSPIKDSKVKDHHSIIIQTEHAPKKNETIKAK